MAAISAASKCMNSAKRFTIAEDGDSSTVHVKIRAVEVYRYYYSEQATVHIMTTPLRQAAGSIISVYIA